MTRLKTLAAMALLFGTATPALAIEINAEHLAKIDRATQACAGKIANGITGGGDVLCIQGRITKDSLRQFQVLQHNPNPILVADSPGGDPAAAVRIAFALIDLHPTIVVPQRCLLACADFLLVASAHKLIANNAELGWGHGFAPFAALRVPESEMAVMHQAVDLQRRLYLVAGANVDLITKISPRDAADPKRRKQPYVTYDSSELACFGVTGFLRPWHPLGLPPSAADCTQLYRPTTETISVFWPWPTAIKPSN